jgi:regulatory protein
MKPKLSLKGRGLQMLAQREQSRSELRRKLLRHAQQAARDAAEAAGAEPVAEPAPDAATPAEQVEAVLDWLQQHQYLSEERFVESRVHARAARFGHQRIRQELALHGLQLPPEAAQQLKETEAARAREVWQRKFGAPAADASGRARQARFLAARGFSGEVIRRVVQGPEDD